MKKNNALESIRQTQKNSIESIENQFATALELANKLYPKIPKEKWRKFFDETIQFGVGLSTEPAFIFLDQNNRIRAIKNSTSEKGIIEVFLSRNFNLLIEALLHPFYKNPATEPTGVPHKVSIEIPEDFSFSEEEFQELQQALANDVVLTKKQGDSSDRENQQGRATFFEFSLRIEK